MKNRLSTHAGKAGWALVMTTALVAVCGSSLLAGPINFHRGDNDRSSNSNSRRSEDRSSRPSERRAEPDRSYRPSTSDRGGDRGYRPDPTPRTSSPSRSERSDSTVFGRKTGRDSYRPDNRPSDRSDNRPTSRPEDRPTYRPGDRSGDTGRDYRPPVTSTPTRPEPKVYTPTHPNREDVNTRSYDRSGSYDRRSGDRSGYYDRSRYYDRVGERNTYRPRVDRSYRPEYSRYYRGSYYRPYTGWREPRFSVGFYYYSWPYEVEPCRYGYYVWDSDSSYAYRSVYFYYGYYPYVYSHRVYVERPTVVYVERPITLDYDLNDDYYLNQPAIGSVEAALDDIRRAWLDNRPELIDQHVRDNNRIAVFLDGDYSYSVNGDDYTQMTDDAMDRVQTVSFNFDRVRQRDYGQVVAYAVHKYYDSSDNLKTVYLSFTLEKHSGSWYVVEVGSSDRPLGR